MDEELQDLLERARSVVLTEEELESHRVAMAAANGHLSDDRITIATMTATRTIMRASESAAGAEEPAR
jgi:hypothetical protein